MVTHGEEKTTMSIFICRRKDLRTGEIWYYPRVGEVEYDCHEAATEDLAMLVGLGIKYLGMNSEFATMAARMLKIDFEG